MIIFATLKTADVGEEVFYGTHDECRAYVAAMSQDDRAAYDSIHICENNGIIVDRIKERRCWSS